jgi:hypothetical protein
MLLFGSLYFDPLIKWWHTGHHCIGNLGRVIIFADECAHFYDFRVHWSDRLFWPH